MSDSVQPHRRQPTRLPHPWDSPGNNAGVGCHFLLQCMKVKSESEVAQSCLTLRDPMDCSLPGSSIHGIFQARVLEWGAIAFSFSYLEFFKKRLTSFWGNGIVSPDTESKTDRQTFLSSFVLRDFSSPSHGMLYVVHLRRNLLLLKNLKRRVYFLWAAQNN